MPRQERVGSKHFARCAVGTLAHSGYRFLGNCYASRQIPARLFPRVRWGDDCDASAYLLDVHEYTKRPANPVHACNLDGITGIFQPPKTNAAQEATWYAAYAVVLWIVVAIVVVIFGKGLRQGKQADIKSCNLGTC